MHCELFSRLKKNPIALLFLSICEMAASLAEPIVDHHLKVSVLGNCCHEMQLAFKN